MVYTVGEMAKLLEVPASTLRYYVTRRACCPLWSAPPAASGCFRSPILSGFRSSTA